MWAGWRRRRSRAWPRNMMPFSPLTLSSSRSQGYWARPQQGGFKYIWSDNCGYHCSISGNIDTDAISCRQESSPHWWLWQPQRLVYSSLIVVQSVRLTFVVSSTDTWLIRIYHVSVRLTTNVSRTESVRLTSSISECEHQNVRWFLLPRWPWLIELPAST